MIKKYIQFINENRDLPELNSFDEIDEILDRSGFDYNSRPLTDNEKKLLDEYCKRFENKFLLTHEQINEVLLDLDLIDNLSFEITNILIKVVDGKVDPPNFDSNGQQIYKNGMGYEVFVKIYLFQLDWNKEVEQTFYNDYWCDNKTVTPSKKKLFDESNLFKLKYLGFNFKEVKTTDIYTSKSEFETWVRKSTIKKME